MYNKTELLKVANFLTEKGIKFVLRPLYDGWQLYVPNNLGQWDFDVIIHEGSYGHEAGLLEVMGISADPRDDIEGYLTGEDVIRRIKIFYIGE